MTEIVSLYGGQYLHKEPNQNCIQSLEKLLEKAKSGEIVGFGLVAQHHDGCAIFEMSGLMGSYSILGAIDILKYNTMKLVNGEE